MRTLAALLLIGLVLVPSSTCNAAASEATRDESEAAPDSVRSAWFEPGDAPTPGGDIRVVRQDDVAGLGVRRRGVRSVGTGWAGHRASLAAGVLPAALTRITLNSHPAGDWLAGGLDLAASALVAPSTPAAPSGPDLSVWPIYTSRWPRYCRGPYAADEGEGALTVDVRPGRTPYATPFSRVTQLAGQYDRKVLAGEFGRWYWSDHLAASGFVESTDGNAPDPGGRYSIDRAGGSLTVPLSSDWVTELGVTRINTERSEPYWGVSHRSDGRTQVRTDLRARATGPSVAIELFHTQSWLESDGAGGAAHSDNDGVFAELTAPLGLDSARISLERRSAGGRLLGGDHDALGGMAEVAASFSPGGTRVATTAGLSILDGVVCPSGSVVVADCGSDILWSARTEYRERRPTALERFMRSVSVPSYDDGLLAVRGTPDLEPEGAASVGGSLSWPGILGGVGVSCDGVLVEDPIVLELSHDGVMSPRNASSEAGGWATLWAAMGDTARVSGEIELSLLAADADGALNALYPLPVGTARASIGLPLSFFEDYLSTRWELSVIHERGLSRGPWRGLVEDRRTAARLTVVGAAGSARVFASVDNLLGTDSARVPGAEPGDVALTAGFSWTFLD